MKISGMVLAGKYEPHLNYCIESIIDIVDEVILFVHPLCRVDRGEEYEEIIKKALLAGKGWEVIIQKGEEVDFASWRNACLEKATGTHILWLDADEILAFANGAPVTRADVEKIISDRPDINNFSFATKHFLYTYFWLDGRNNGEHWSMRLFKNDGRRFTGKVHESLPNNDKERVGLLNPQIWHFGHCKGMEDLRQKYEKTGKIPDNPYGMRTDNDKFCSTHELFRGTRSMMYYNGKLPRVMKLW